MSELSARIEKLDNIIKETLRALPVGNIKTHTPESIPERVSYYVAEYARLSESENDLRGAYLKAWHALNALKYDGNSYASDVIRSLPEPK